MPYSTIYGDYYYSRADGRAECSHVFHAGNNLAERVPVVPHFTIAELGFGTGLNFLETGALFSRIAPEGATLTFHSFEAHPMSRTAMARALSAWPDLPGTDALMDAWDGLAGDAATPVRETQWGRTRLVLHTGDALERLAAATALTADAWFLDGFSPARNPAMWSAGLMRLVAGRTAPGGTFATYTAAGWVRRNLAEAGFIVRKQRGYAGKRDMTCGFFPPERTGG